MKVVVQRVKNASVKVNQNVIGEIKKGLVVLLGVAAGDTKADINWMVEKVLNLRIFPSHKKNMDRSVKKVNGELLVVPQFTLLGNCNKGRRPSFDKAASPEIAESLYNYFIEEIKQSNLSISTGEFKKHMDVSLVNDGPVTFMISRDR